MSTYSNQLQPTLQTYYNMLFGSFTRDRHARRIYLWTFAADETLVKPVTWHNI